MYVPPISLDNTCQQVSFPHYHLADVKDPTLYLKRLLYEPER